MSSSSGPMKADLCQIAKIAKAPTWERDGNGAYQYTGQIIVNVSLEARYFEGDYQVGKEHFDVFQRGPQPNEGDYLYAFFYAANPALWRDKYAIPIWRGDVYGTPSQIEKIPGRREFICTGGSERTFKPSDADWEAKCAPALAIGGMSSR